MLVYDVTEESLFEEIPYWMHEIEDVSSLQNMTER